MGACRAIAVMGVIAGIATLTVAAAASAPPVTGGLKDETLVPEKAITQNERAKPPPPCPKVIGTEPVDMSRCRHRVVTGAARPKPYPVIPALFPTPGKP